MSETFYDVIVVGAGPGGATTAWKCAERGLRVLLLDRAAQLPRYKPCGGGIPASLATHVSGFEESERFADLSVTHLRHSWKGKDTVLAEMTTESGAPAHVWMVQRAHFDAWLVERAQAAGATVRTGVKVSDVAVSGETITVSTATGETFAARHVVGADGAKGIVGARVGLRLGKRWGIAREAEIPFETNAGGDNRFHADLHPGAAYLDYGSVPNGYAWIFPKRGFLSVGAGMLLPKKPAENEENNVGQVLRRAIDTMLASVGQTFPEGMDAPRIWGHPIPFWTGAEPLATADNRVLLVGDAAGVVQPMFGEGIQYAIRTGDVAADCLASGTVGEYTNRVRALFADEFDAALRIGKMFYRTPFLSYKLGVKNPAGTKLVGRLMAGEAHLHDLEQRIYERLRNPLKRKG
ncbi:MAG: geranylgeranyl reductase family protein [Armatimonadetes bacterium]|nr:geranylgeranyl reductase family protein [Armatimonadota bacterium]